MQEISTERQSAVLSCDECSGLVIESSGAFVCRSCGLIVDRVLKPARVPEWDFFQRSKIMIPLGSKIHTSIHKNKHWRMGDVNSSNQYEKKMYREIDTICNTLELSNNITIRSLNIFKDLYAKNLKYQSHILIAVSIIIAAREERYPLEHDDLLNTLRALGRNVKRTFYNRCLMDLNIKLSVLTPADYVPKYVFELEKKFQNYPPPLMLKQLITIFSENFNNLRPTSYTFCCIMISYNITYGLTRYSIGKVFRNEPAAYYPLCDKILSCYNQTYDTLHSFS